MSEAYEIESEASPRSRNLHTVRNLGSMVTLGAGGRVERVPQKKLIHERFLTYCLERMASPETIDYTAGALFGSQAHNFLLDDVRHYFAQRFPDMEPKLIPPARVEAKLETLLQMREKATGDSKREEAFQSIRQELIDSTDSHRDHFLELKGIGMLRANLKDELPEAALEALTNLHAAYGMVIDELPKLWQMEPARHGL